MQPADKITLGGVRARHNGKAPGATESPMPTGGLDPLKTLTAVSRLTVAVQVRVMVTSPAVIPSRMKVQIPRHP